MVQGTLGVNVGEWSKLSISVSMELSPTILSSNVSMIAGNTMCRDEGTISIDASKTM